MLDAGDILDTAQAQVDVPDPDRAIIARHLGHLVASINAQANLSPQGEAITHAQLLGKAIERLEARRWLRDLPGAANESIEAPLFLTGLPRSGTTAFQYLFDRDPRFRLIRTWESSVPHPPPGTDPASVERRKAREADRRGKVPLPKGFEAIHLMDLDGPEECHGLMERGFVAAGFHNMLDVPDFFDWTLDHADFETAYRLHKQQLQLWQWKQPPRRWALKYPNHVLAMDAIVAVYPDARFVMTHRDPVQVVASIAKLTLMLRAMRTATPPDPHGVGRQMLHFVARHIDRIMAFTDGPEAHRIVHTDYYRMLDDPAGMMADVQSRLGIECPSQVTAAIADWHTANPKGKRGVNVYALDQFGLSADAVAEQFTAYRRRFAIPREAAALAALGF